MTAARLSVLVWGFFCLMATATLAQTAISPDELQFFTKSPHAILMDARTGQSLYEKGADEPIAPASMMKLMTMIMVFERLDEGTLTLDQEFFVSKNAWKKGGAKGGGSSMYLEPETRVRLGDLIQGAIVQSGNDACIVIAESLSGSEEAFANLMTFRAREMGLKVATFKNATGLHDPEQKVTPRELALLAEFIIRKFPQYYHYFRQPSFTWNDIAQANRNPLLAEYPGTDGLKTGYVKESGYGLVGSAVRNDRRLILVLSGLESAADRRAEAQKLLDWGFRQFKPHVVYNTGDRVGEIRVWGGTKSSTTLMTKEEIRIALSEEESKDVRVELVYTGPLIAPVRAGEQAGMVRFSILGRSIKDVPVYTAEDIAATDSRWKRAFDSLIIMAIGG